MKLLSEFCVSYFSHAVHFFLLFTSALCHHKLQLQLAQNAPRCFLAQRGNEPDELGWVATTVNSEDKLKTQDIVIDDHTLHTAPSVQGQAKTKEVMTIVLWSIALSVTCSSIYLF